MLEELASMELLERADDAAQKNAKPLSRRYIEKHNRHRQEELERLREMIMAETLPEPTYRIRRQYVNGKWRNIALQDYYPWRLLNAAVAILLMEDLQPTLLLDVTACIKGRGIHFGLKRLRTAIRRHPEYTHFVKADFCKFYESLPHDSLEAMLRRHYKDERFIRLVMKLTTSLASGEDITKRLEDEARKKRHHAWSGDFRTAGKSVSEQDRP